MDQFGWEVLHDRKCAELACWFLFSRIEEAYRVAQRKDAEDLNAIELSQGALSWKGALHTLRFAWLCDN
jgi:hypothetical protein